MIYFVLFTFLLAVIGSHSDSPIGLSALPRLESTLLLVVGGAGLALLALICLHFLSRTDLITNTWAVTTLTGRPAPFLN